MSRRRFDDHPTYTREEGEQQRTLFEPRSVPRVLVSGVHVVDAGERIDLDAWQALGDPHRWWRLADANPTRRPEELAEPGRTLNVPVDD